MSNNNEKKSLSRVNLFYEPFAYYSYPFFICFSLVPFSPLEQYIPANLKLSLLYTVERPTITTRLHNAGCSLYVDAFSVWTCAYIYAGIWVPGSDKHCWDEMFPHTLSVRVASSRWRVNPLALTTLSATHWLRDLSDLPHMRWVRGHNHIHSHVY